MSLVLNKKSQDGKKSLSDHPNFSAKVPRLNVAADGIAEIDPENPMHRKWFEEFKKK